MQHITIEPGGKLTGELTVPADKSISQRAVILAALSRGTTVIRHFLAGDDSRCALNAFARMGVRVSLDETSGDALVSVLGKGAFGLSAPHRPLYLGNSGTTMRLLSGVLAAQPFASVLAGDTSLSQRPMERICEPLRRMGASIRGHLTPRGRELPPLRIQGGRLAAIRYHVPVPSAQVKSCVLLAGLFARGTTVVSEPVLTRDHTERMLALFQAPLTVRGRTVTIRGGQPLRSPKVIVVPGDISSAAFFLVAASILPASSVCLRAVGINPTRAHLLRVLRRMGAQFRVQRTSHSEGCEPSADIRVRAARLRGIMLSPLDTAQCIDELPILCVAACYASGTTRFHGVAELRVKETDRVASLVRNLSAMGAAIESKADSIIIRGGKRLQGAPVKSFGDHRTAMSMAVAALAADGATHISDTGCVTKSYPLFFEHLSGLRSNS